MNRRSGLWAGTALLLALAGAAHAQTPPAAPPPPVAIEESDVATLPPLTARMLLVNTNWGSTGARLFDGDSGKMLGQVQVAQLSNVAADSAGRFLYVAESIWSKGNRGTRQDMLTVRDARTLALVREIALPGRILVGTRKHNLSISADGRQAVVFNMDPASSLVVVDLARNRVSGSVEVPGCGLAAIAAPGKVLSLCADGGAALTTLDARGKGAVARVDPFFNAESDPIFDNFALAPGGGAAMMLSYSGLVYPVAIGGSGVAPGQPWSLQEAAGVPRGAPTPLAVNWLPGGRQPLAWHQPSGRLFVLMHTGEYWTQKEPGTELWMVDVATKKVVRRKKLEHEASFVEVGQDAQPLLYLHHDGKLWVLDAATLEEKHEIKEVGDGALTVFGSAS